MEPDSMPLDPMTTERPATTPCAGKPRIAACLGAAAAAFGAGAAHASFLSGEALDTAADVLAWVVIVLVPLVGIAVFWIVHVLPEKIAHRRHHPQTAAIQTLCLLSLVFGGLLWPFAWLWAYTKPVAYKVAYGTEKGEHYFEELGEKARAGEILDLMGKDFFYGGPLGMGEAMKLTNNFLAATLMAVSVEALVTGTKAGL